MNTSTVSGNGPVPPAQDARPAGYAAAARPGADRAARARRSRTLWKWVGVVAAAHVLLTLVLSPSLFFGRGETLEGYYARGEEALAKGQYAEAMRLFRQVMDKQPKPPAIFGKAADQHRLA